MVPFTLKVTTGRDATFMATEYNATLNPEYTWFFNGGFIRSDPSKYSGRFSRSLTIINPQKADEGNYTCEVAIGGGNGEATGQLLVCESILYD